MALISVRYPHPPGKSGGVMALHTTVMAAVPDNSDDVLVNVLIVDGKERYLR